MRQPSALDPLTNTQLNICAYRGWFGVLLALTCLIQLMIVGPNHWMINVILVIYLVAGSSYLFLALQKHFAPILLIISLALVIIAELLWIFSFAISVIVLLLVVYNVVIVILVYVEQVPAQLRKRKQALDAEETNWDGKI
jgi:ABC-type uncharacterized transport system permease subunit